MCNCNHSDNNNICLKKQLCHNLGKFVTIFTEAGEFTGCIEGVNNELVRLVSKEKKHEPKPCEDICGHRSPGGLSDGCSKQEKRVCDILIDKIIAVCRKEKD